MSTFRLDWGVCIGHHETPALVCLTIHAISKRLDHFHGALLGVMIESYDVITAAAVLHHLRDDSDQESTFRRF